MPPDTFRGRCPRNCGWSTAGRGMHPHRPFLSTALDHLHRQCLVHRDIKPANIIFVDGAPKLADIGLVADMSEAVLRRHGRFIPRRDRGRCRPMSMGSARSSTKSARVVIGWIFRHCRRICTRTRRLRACWSWMRFCGGLVMRIRSSGIPRRGRCIQICCCSTTAVRSSGCGPWNAD